jgi:Transposase DDE domain
MRKKMADVFSVLGFDECYFNQIAFTTNFKKRVRTLTCFDFVFVLIVNASNTVMSYNTLASSIADDLCKLVTKQALQKAMIKDEFMNCLEAIYKDVLLSKLKLNGNRLKGKYKRIIIQDSTIINLPQRLFSIFSGVSNGLVQVANARIQIALDILCNHIIHFSLDSYSTNDIKAANQLSIQQGDLLIRDRGYFSIAEIKRIIKASAHFIYRYKHGINYCHVNTGEPINLLKKLNKTKTTDIMVKLGDINGPVVRLIAMPVKTELADMRRAKLKKQAKHHPQKEVLALLSWSIFITSIEDESMNYDEIFELYKLRWRIEILFKAMKSHLNLGHIHNVSNNQLKFIVLAKLLWLVLILQFVYELLITLIKKYYDKDLSFLKLIRLLTEHKNVLCDLMGLTHKNKINDCQTLKILAKYCTYDKRKRNNFTHQFSTIPIS